MRNCILVRVCQRLPDSPDGPAWSPGIGFVGARRPDFKDDWMLAKTWIDSSGKVNEAIANRLFLHFILFGRQSFPRLKFAVGRDHNGTIASRGAFKIAGRGDR